MDTIRKSKTSLLSILGMLGIAACISFAIDPPLDTELNDIPGDTHLGEWVQAISSNQVSESVYVTNNTLMVNGMEYPVGGDLPTHWAWNNITNENGETVTANDIDGGNAGSGMSVAELLQEARGLAQGAEESASLAMSQTAVVALAATNYTDSATNSLRGKTDMVVYANSWGYQNSEFGLYVPTTPTKSHDEYEADYEWVCTTNTSLRLAWWGNQDGMELYIWRLYRGSEIVLENTPWGNPFVEELYLMDYVSGEQEYMFVHKNVVFPTADRLATTGGVAIAIASAVPAGVVVTNESGQIESDLSIMGGISVGGSLQALNGTFYGLLTVNGTNVMAALASKATSADIASAISTNNPAFVAAVTNIIQNLPQDTLQALKTALNALP